MNTLRVCAWLAVLAVVSVDGKHQQGTLESGDGFAFASLFCFDWTPHDDPDPSGWIELTLYADEARSTDLQVLLYDDEAQSWPNVSSTAGEALPCHERVRLAKNAHWVTPAPYRVRWGKDGAWTMAKVPVFEHVRPRFWYLVVADCRGFKDLRYDVTFTNRGPDWNRQFGVNEQHLNTVYIVFFAFYCLFLLVHVTNVHQFFLQTQFVHPLVKIMTITIVAQFIAVFCHTVHLVLYTHDGVGLEELDIIGEMASAVAKIVFTMLLILLAGGWTISTDRIPHKNVLVNGMGMLMGLYVFLIALDAVTREGSETNYIYDSVPGVMIAALDLCLGAWYHLMMHKSYTTERDRRKKHFYRLLWGFFGIWFITVPLMLALSEWVVWPWQREKWIRSLSLSMTTVVYASMAFLLAPSRVDEHFAITVPDVANTYHDYRDL